MINLDKDISEALELYSSNISEEVKQVANEAGKEGLKFLKTTGDYQDRTGKYRKSFRLKKYEEYDRRKHGVVIYSSGGHHRLTHLLENGHMKSDGTGRVKARPHWTPTEEFTVALFEEKLEQKLKEVGI